MPPKRRNTRNSRREPTPPVEETTEQIINRRVAEAIAQHEATRNSDNTNDTRNPEPGNVANNPENTQRGCSYKAFLACKPSTFTGTEGAIGLVHWIEKMESVIDISDCATNNVVKYATCTLADKALTWWNAQVQIIGRTAAYSMTWEALKQMMMEEFCSPNETQKLETELWNIKMIGADITGYTTRFHELARLVPHMVTPESKRIERYNKGLAPQIRGMVMSSKPTTFRSAVDLAHSLTDDAILIGTLKTTAGKTEPTRTDAGESGNNKRKWNNEGNDRQGQQNRNVGNPRAYAAITNTEQKPYLGKRPKCGKCGKHHEGDCFFCDKCNRFGHQTQACRTHPANNEQRNNGCFRCGESGHYRNQCPQLNNPNNNQTNNRGDNNRDNQNNNRNANIPNATGRAYILRGKDAQPDPYANIGTFKQTISL